MSLAIDLFWSFRSPYSYLATPRLAELARTEDLDVNVRIVLPLAVRSADFFDKVNPLWPPYLMRDTMRIAESLGLDYGWPRPDPVVQSVVDGKLVTAPDQPHIHRLSRLGTLAAERGAGLAFIEQVSAAIFGGKIDGWHEGAHLREAAARAGLDLAEMDTAIQKDPERYDAQIAESQGALEAAGHWGVPTMVFDGEPFFGQDRIDLLVWRLREQGLEPRK